MIRLDARAADFEADFARLLGAPRASAQQVEAEVRAILEAVRARGDAALREFTARFDGGDPARPARVPTAEIEAASRAVPEPLLAALDLAAARIEAFHRAQMPVDLRMTDAAGVRLGLRWTPVEAAGLYVPGGKAAYPSSVLMNAIPARVAGVSRLAMCVPAPGGALNPLVLAAAQRAGITEIHRVGGAQAIAALAFGTETIRPVDRIVGPGNAWVAEAKRQVSGRVGIDSVAGPSEVVVLADGGCDPHHVALDLLAQAEHDEAAQSILISTDAAFGEAVVQAVAAVLPTLEREAIARAAWEAHGAIVIVPDWEVAVALVDRLAPEHVQVMIEEAEAIGARLRHAGAVFLGRDCPEALGDYVAGPNHVLPTARSARFASGLSVYDFLKRTTWVAAEAAQLTEIGAAAARLARAEGLTAHARSLEARLEPAGPPALPDDEPTCSR